MFTLLEKAVVLMALLRMLSGSIEIFAAYMMIRFNEIEKALIINSSLALVGPLILIITTTIGLNSVADKISFDKLIWIILGVTFIIFGIKSN
ncbi:YqhV family protein [Oceanobacillus rekensis]|uniref:YqhV family protein n=1 Tax=Oceanobacillus rekensis TaxID=937927 RepID=UPI000B43C53A|nr:YqhV family protein [Oceanobacillus rekensis]